MEFLRGEDRFGSNWQNISVSIQAEIEELHCPLGYAPADFFAFPGMKGYAVRESGEISEAKSDDETDESKSSQHIPRPAFFQGWLFFGLLSTVVKINGEPLLPYKSLKAGAYLKTTNLPDALKDWEKWETAPENRAGATVRLIHIGEVLEHARKVVRANLAEAHLLEDFSEPNPRPGKYDSGGKGKNGIPRSTSLSIMILGEALTGAASRIKNAIGLNLEGWYMDEREGWGLPGYVLCEMWGKKWCPRAVHILTGQLQYNATLLLAASRSHTALGEDSRVVYSQSGIAHRLAKCDRTKCRVVSGMEMTEKKETLERPTTRRQPEKISYRPQHLECSPDEGDDCHLVGPDMGKVCDILAKGEMDFPLFQFDGDSLKLKVTSYLELKSNERHFATISHVWSDGMGNVDFNQINLCQLKYLRNQLSKFPKPPGSGEAPEPNWIMPFWLDTFAIPVVSETDKTPTILRQLLQQDPNRFQELKRRSIRQIFNVFNKAEHCIVIDRGLLLSDYDGGMLDVTMKILASGWMKRLWTLQEGFVSKKLHFAFKPSIDSKTDGLFNFDQYYEHIDTTKKGHNFSSYIDMAVYKTFRTMLGYERGARRVNRDTPLSLGHGYVLVANTWQAAQWRVTEKEVHEVLALASLLDLKYNVNLVNDGKMADGQVTQMLEDLMVMFWKRIQEERRGAIPAGIIFLPGEKLTTKGFRWAPKTWMLARGEDPPFSLDLYPQTSTFEDRGLHFQYPGFLLHGQDRKKVLSMSVINASFCFPVDKSRLEWYVARPAEDIELSLMEPNAHIVNKPEDGAHGTDLAIILSRPRPADMPEHIGLLVQIHEVDTYQPEGKEKHDVWVCKTIHRVKISRISPPKHSRWELPDACIGEAVEATQWWCLDGRERPASQTPEDRFHEQQGDTLENVVDDGLRDQAASLHANEDGEGPGNAMGNEDGEDSGISIHDEDGGGWGTRFRGYGAALLSPLGYGWKPAPEMMPVQGAGAKGKGKARKR